MIGSIRPSSVASPMKAIANGGGREQLVAFHVERLLELRQKLLDHAEDVLVAADRMHKQKEFIAAYARPTPVVPSTAKCLQSISSTST